MTGWRKHFRREFSHLQTFINEEKYHMNITLFNLLMKTFGKSTNAVYCRGRSPPPRRRRITWRCSAAASRGESHSEIFCYVKFCDYSRWNNEPQHYHHYYIAICRYLHCSEQVVNSTCGTHTAGFTKQFLDRMSGPLVQQHCMHYEHGSELCPHNLIEDTGLQSPRYGSEAGSGAASFTTSLFLCFTIVILSWVH